MNEILNMEQQNNQENNPKLPIKNLYELWKTCFPPSDCWKLLAASR